MKYEIYIHTGNKDIYYGCTPIKEQKETIVKKLLHRKKDVKIIALVNGHKYESIIFY